MISATGIWNKCLDCQRELVGAYHSKKYCNQRCKARWRKKNTSSDKVLTHDCRMCGKTIRLKPGQGNKWLCSPACRRASVAKAVRTFHERRPQAEAMYRARTKAKRLPDSNLVRFRRTNPKAPTKCESCGEDRVLDVAHKPGYERIGEWRSRSNTRWPEMVWVLCPTCHALIDRMNYDPAELGLS